MFGKTSSAIVMCTKLDGGCCPHKLEDACLLKTNPVLSKNTRLAKVLKKNEWSLQTKVKNLLEFNMFNPSQNKNN